MRTLQMKTFYTPEKFSDKKEPIFTLFNPSVFLPLFVFIDFIKLIYQKRLRERIADNSSLSSVPP